jgi:hypothetical protein
MSENELKAGPPEDAPTALKAAPETWRAWWQRSQANPRVPAIAVLHLFALVNLAVVQPVFNLISLEPMVLVVHRVRPAEIVLVALCMSLILPLVFALPLLAAGRLSARLQRLLLTLMVFALLVAIALPAWKRMILLSGDWLVGLALVTAALATWIYWRFAAMRLLVSYAAVGGLLFPLLFLLRPPASLLVFPPDAQPVSTAEIKNPAPVVMVVFDEFSMATLLDAQRQIDAEKFPHFAALAKEATWYRNATSMSGYTQFALPALLTGRLPRNVPATYANFQQNLFTMLANQYELTVFEPYTTLCPNEVDPEVIQHTPARRLNRFAQELLRIYVQFVLPFDLAPASGTRHAQPYNKWGFERQRQKPKGLIRYNWARDRAEQFKHFLETIQPGQRPPLYFCHVALPHTGYGYFPSGREHDAPQDAIGNYWPNDAWTTAQYQQHYLLQVAFVDRLLGRLVARLKEAGIYDSCLLVIVADHGVTLRPGHHMRDATPESAPDIMWIPLFIKAPQQTQGVATDRNMEIIDVLPTMVDLLQIRRPWKMDGISAADPQTPARADKTLYRTTEKTLRFTADFPEKNSTLSQKLQWFSTPGGIEALFRFGPNKELVGKRVDELPVSPRAKWRVTLEAPEALKGVRSDTTPWPAYVTGAVDARAVSQGPISIAVAVNGRIQAVTRSHRSLESKLEWQALLPEDAIGEGDNEVNLYIIRRSGDGIVLEATRRR